MNNKIEISEKDINKIKEIAIQLFKQYKTFDRTLIICEAFERYLISNKKLDLAFTVTNNDIKRDQYEDER